MILFKALLVTDLLLNAMNGQGALFTGQRIKNAEVKLQLRVKVYNSAHVSLGDLMEAEERAGAILLQAKINVNWDLVPLVGSVGDQKPSEEWNPADLHLRLWTHSMLGSNSFSEDTLGFCLSMEKSTAIVVADEIGRRAALDFANPGDLLGLVMAHEIGHLLLRSPAHSIDGIMQARLPTAVRDRRRALLAFSRGQGAAIRSEIHRRTGVQSARRY